MKFDRLVEIVRVVFSALEVFLVIGCIAELFGHLRHAPVAYGVFHGDRGGVGCFVVGNELVFQHIGHGVLQRIGRGGFHRTVGPLGVEAADTLRMASEITGTAL